MPYKRSKLLPIFILSGVFFLLFSCIEKPNSKNPVVNETEASVLESNAEREDLNLVWSDEFDGEALNEEDWTIVTGDGCPNLCGWGNNELQYYRSENLSVSDGLLTITAKKEAFGNRDFTSARIKTDNKVSVKYGRIDVRARLPKTKGLWPAIWMLGESIDSIGWPSCGEIDIMELRGSAPDKVCGTLHFQNIDNQHQNSGVECYTLESDDFSDDFHVFSLEWDESQMTWYVDDIPFNKLKMEDLNIEENANPFFVEFYFLFNLAVGGNYDGNPDETTVFPQTLVVDYIRVYE